ncbi:arginine--tRNA ligase, partial [Campylobacter lari]
HKDKMSRGYDKCINIWGADHHGYIARMKAAMEFLGHDSQNLEIILAQMVSLLKNGEPYKMSKRAGNFILMGDVLEELGSDVLRYIFISKKCDTHLEFDVDEFKKEDSSNPVYYINYAHARIHQVFAKAGKSVDDVMYAKFESLNEDGMNLLFESLNLKAVLN